MQKLMLPFATMILFSISIMANEWPKPRLPLAVQEFRGDPSGWEKKLSIFTDGDVYESFRPNAQTPWEHELLAILGSDAIEDLFNLVGYLEAGEIIFPDSQKCSNAPVVSYKGLNWQRTHHVEFAREVDCRFGTLQNFDEANRFKIIFTGLDALLIPNNRP